MPWSALQRVDDVTWTVSGHHSRSGSFRSKDSVRRDLLGPLGAEVLTEPAR